MIFRLACMVGIETSGQPFFRLATCRNCASGVMVPMNIFRGVSCLMALFRQLRKRNILTSCANVWQQFSAAELWSWVLLFQITDLQGKPVADVSTFQQPTKAGPQQISEFSYVHEVRVLGEEPVLDDKGNLLQPFHHIPPGSKRLRTCRKQVGDSSGIFMLFGVYRSEWEFVQLSQELPHPFSLFCDVPDCTLKLMFFALTEGPSRLNSYRLSVVTKWQAWAKELEMEEDKLHRTWDSKIASVMKSKRILLLKRIAESFDWPDMSVFDEMAKGFMLTGMPSPSGLFPLEVNVPALTPDQLDDRKRSIP